jgi:hypothetical protein
MRRIAVLGLTIGALLALSGCQTDNGPPVVTAPPSAPPANEAPTAATTAWAAQMVGDALAAEKTARDGGKAPGDVQAAVTAVVSYDVQTYIGMGASVPQVMAGLRLAAADPRNTPVTQQVLQELASELISPPTSVGSSGGIHCTGCKGKN